MARTGTITLYEGVAKISKKPFTALKLEVGTWSKLYFVDSQFELDYIKKQLATDEQKEQELDDLLDIEDVSV